jgi:hypothetical protein
LHVDGVLATAVTKGSARMLTTTSSKASAQILCGAFVTDAVNAPPEVAIDLPVTRRNTQQGQ